MSVYPIVSCAGSFDTGRFPCAAYLPLPHARHVQGWILDVDAARMAAWEQGWSQTPTGDDLCPAHTRAHGFEAYRQAVEQAPPIDRDETLRALGINR